MATVTGTIKSCDNTAVRTQVVITSVSAPVIDDGAVISVTRRTVDSNASGQWSVTLLAGDYIAEWHNGSVLTRVTFAVTDTAGSIDIANLITETLTYTRTVDPQYVLKTDPDQTFRVTNGKLQFYNATTTLWHTIWCIGSGDTVRFVADSTGEA